MLQFLGRRIRRLISSLIASLASGERVDDLASVEGPGKMACS